MIPVSLAHGYQPFSGTGTRLSVYMWNWHTAISLSVEVAHGYQPFCGTGTRLSAFLWNWHTTISLSVELAHGYQPFCGTQSPFFGPEDGNKIFFPSSAKHVQDYRALQHYILNIESSKNFKCNCIQSFKRRGTSPTFY